MAKEGAAFERAVLYRSILVTGLLGLLGVIWGIASGSQMILLDGVYATIGIAVSGLLVLAAKLAEERPSRRYPYGKQSVVPLVIGLQGAIMTATLAYAAFEAVGTIREGGTDLSPTWAIVYGAVSATASTAFWLWLRARARGSDLLVAEATAWMVGSLRSVGMIVGFTLMALLAGTGWEGAVPYVDPAMVLVTCAAFLPSALGLVRGTIIELLEGAPDDAVQAPVHEAIARMQERFELDPPRVRMNKVGSKLYVEVDGLVDPSVTVAQEHEVRCWLETELQALPHEVWLNLELLPR